MIVYSEDSGLKSRLGYKELAKRYLEYYGVFEEEDFVVNMILLIDAWEKEEKLQFDRIMPSDWELLMKAVKVLSVDEPIA